MKVAGHDGTPTGMRFTRALVSSMLLAACFQPTVDIVTDAGPSFPEVDAGGLPAGGGGGVSSSGDAGGTITHCAPVWLEGGYQTVCATVPDRVTCGGRRCEVGEECCFPTLKCVGPDAGTCVSPVEGLCASNFDCSEGEICLQGGACDSLGTCELRGQCPTSFPVGEPIFCGCDGLNYRSLQEACVAGRTINGYRSVCGAPDTAGNIPCGVDLQCPDGQACCGLTGFCFNAADPWRCERQPGSGVIFNCESDQECKEAGTYGGGPGTDRVCEHAGCSGPGFCTSPQFSTPSCGGEVAQVCGCDGVTYVNECWAHSAGTNVSSTGACP